MTLYYCRCTDVYGRGYILCSSGTPTYFDQLGKSKMS